MRRLKQTCDFTAEIGDFDLNRNLKIQTFAGFALAPVFRELQSPLTCSKMGERGITAMRYLADFENDPDPLRMG